jgi:hypothetical protein
MLTVLKGVPKAIEGLIKVYEGISNDILERKHRSFGLGESHELYVDSVNKIPSIDLFKSLVAAKKKSTRDLQVKHFKDLMDTFEFLRLQNARVKPNFLSFIDEYRKYEERWGDNFDSILRFFDEILSVAKRNQIPKSEDPFLSELDNLFVSTSKVESVMESLYVSEERIVDPLKKLCQEHIKDERAVKLMPFVVNCRRIFKDYLDLKDVFGKAFLEEAEQLRRIKTSLEESIAFFKANGSGVKA